MGKSHTTTNQTIINKKVDEHILQSFLHHHPNPVIIVKHKLFSNPEIIYFNISYSNFAVCKMESELNFQSFLQIFYFTSEPVNILASKENIKAFHKKTGGIYQLIIQQADDEHVIIEIVKIHSETSLKRNEYRELVNFLPEIVFELDTNLTFSFLNQSALDTFGFTLEDLNAGIHVENIILKRDYPKFKKYLDSIFEGKTTKEKLVSIVRKDGKISLVEVYISVIKQGIKIKGVSGIAIDITHRKKIEEKLLQAKKRIEDADKLKTSFLMNMSHEIRTPLNSVLGYTQLLQRKIDDPELSTYLKNIGSSGKGLLKLINDLIDLSKIYADQLDILPSEINLNKIIDKLEKDFLTEIELKKKNIELKNTKGLSDGMDINFMDEDRLKQIFTSLFNNALKFTESGYIDFGYHLVNKNILFFIKDTGEGMDNNIKQEIFEDFHKPVIHKKYQRGGAGIGLAITRGIIEKMGGKIWVESEPGKGSLFNFTLPYNKTDKINEQKEHPKKQLEGLKNKNILVVEDDNDNFFILKSFLQETKANIIHANNGIKALEICNEKHIDVIFMDINLPDMDGCEITGLIRRNNKDVIIIAQSAYVMKEDKQKCYAAGCDAFIEKPINGDFLISTLSSFLKENT